MKYKRHPVLTTPQPSFIICYHSGSHELLEQKESRGYQRELVVIHHAVIMGAFAGQERRQFSPGKITK